MGMFDTVVFKCPNCGSDEVEQQSKAGICCCFTYEQDQVPLEIACDISGEEVECYKCNKKFFIQFVTKPEPPKTYQMKLIAV